MEPISNMRAVSLLALLLASPAMAASATIYKYVDKDGRTVISGSIPAEYVKNGYTILNEKGQVVQEVKRAPTAEELAKMEAGKAAEMRAQTEKAAREESDKLLIRLYRDPEEIVKKRDTGLNAQNSQADLIKNNLLVKAEAEVKRWQGTVDTDAKNGKQSSADTLKKLEQAKANKDKVDAQLKKIEEDKSKLIADSARDYQRLRELMSLPAQAIKAPPTFSEEPKAPASPTAEKPAAK